MNYLINSRPYSAMQSLAAEFAYLPNKNYLFELDYLTTLAVEGDNAREFLQGQLSCDMREVSQLSMRQGVMCNLKGRILAALDVIYETEQRFSLVVPKDLCTDTQASLAKAALFSRVQLRQNPVKVYGLFVQSDEDLKPFGFSLPADRYGVVCQEGVCCYQIGPAFYKVIIQPGLADNLCESYIHHGQYRGSLAWHALQLQHQRVEIYPESKGLFLPHRLDMHKTGYLNFEKGCYKGQEIIARMHYRGTQKHHLACISVQADAPLYSGQVLYSEEGDTVVGELVDYCIVAEGQPIIVASVLLSYDGRYPLRIAG